MTDRPIIFSGPMVRALLEGRKTQTRRMIKVPSAARLVYTPKGADHWLWTDGDGDSGSVRIPYAPGDRLYVREAFCPRLGYPAPIAKPHYRADDDRPEWRGLWQPSIHMPRWASRLTLTVTEVRVQRLQEISEADVWAEGIPGGAIADCYGPDCPSDPGRSCNAHGCWATREKFRDLWNSLHGSEAWDANPWIVVVSFTTRKGNIDAA